MAYHRLLSKHGSYITDMYMYMHVYIADMYMYMHVYITDMYMYMHVYIADMYMYIVYMHGPEQQ